MCFPAASVSFGGSIRAGMSEPRLEDIEGAQRMVLEAEEDLEVQAAVGRGGGEWAAGEGVGLAEDW